VDGVDYHFLRLGRTEAEANAEFLRKVENGEMFEHTRLYGNRYGTPKKQLEEAIASGKQVIADVNIEGLWALKKAYPNQVQGIFLLPPSIEILKARLQKRLAQAGEALNQSWAEIEHEKKQHIDQALETLKEAPFYDTVIEQQKSRPKAVYAMIKRALDTPINQTFSRLNKPPSED
jgi:guanylate kinase